MTTKRNEDRLEIGKVPDRILYWVRDPVSGARWEIPARVLYERCGVAGLVAMRSRVEAAIEAGEFEEYRCKVSFKEFL